MAYTPVGWQTGDTITADRLNRMDRGWGYESTELFSETVTTADAGHGIPEAQLVYSQQIIADTITVAYDGTEYECPRIDIGSNHYYGGFSTSGPDFTNYPFVIESRNSANAIYTKTASTHTVVATVSSLQTSADFAEAASSALGGAFYPVTSGDTSWQEIADAMGAGKVVFRSYFEEADEFAQFNLITGADTDGQGTYRVHFMTAGSSGVYTDTVSAASADSPLSF